MRKQTGIALLGALAATGLAGCVTEEGFLTLAATRPVPLDARDIPPDTDAAQLPVMHDIEGTHTAVTSVLFMPTFAGPHLEAAVEDAITRGRGDVLTRARVSTTKWWFLIGVETVTVRGNVVDLPGVD